MKTTALLKDSQGKVIQKQSFQNGSQQEFDVEKLKDGVYYVELQLARGKSITHQLYINH